MKQLVQLNEEAQITIGDCGGEIVEEFSKLYFHDVDGIIIIASEDIPFSCGDDDS